MRLLDRYLLRELLVPLGYCLGGFLVFWTTYDLYTELGNFQSRHLGVPDIAEYYLIKTPETLVRIIPIALLLALLYALTNHARHHELTAARAAGVTLWRLVLPYFAVALLGSLFLLLLDQWAVQRGMERAEQIMNRYSATPTADPRWHKGVVFRNDRDERSWHIGAYNAETFAMQKPHLEWRQPGGMIRVLDADRALRTNDVWVFQDVQEVILPADSVLISEPDQWPTPKRWAELPLPELTETPRLILSEIKISRLDSLKTARKAHLGVGEILDYLELHPQLDSRRGDLLRTMLHHRFALPWTCVVVVLISIPFGAASGRRNVFVGVAGSVFICFTYYVVNELSLALGARAAVVPWLAAWAPNLLFGLAGLVMTQRTR